MLTPDVIKRLKANPDFSLFIEHILDNSKVLDSIFSLGDLNGDDIPLEVKARSRALEILEDILSPIVNFKEKKEVSDDERKKQEEKYGLA